MTAGSTLIFIFMLTPFHAIWASPVHALQPGPGLSRMFQFTSATGFWEEHWNLPKVSKMCHLTYSPQHSTLKNPQPTFLSQCQRPNFTPIQNNRQNYSSVYLNQTSLVFWWSAFLTTDHEVPGSIPSSTRGDSYGDHGLGSLVELRFKAPPRF
jgi:hypothetical protein